MSSVGFAFCAMICSAIIKIIYRQTMKSGVCAWTALLFSNFTAAIIITFSFQMPYLGDISRETLLILLANGLLWSIPCVLELGAYKYIDASVGEVYSSLRLIVIALGGVFIFHETFSALQLLGAALIFFAIIFNLKCGKLSFNKGTAYITSATLLIAVALMVDKYLTQIVDAKLILLSGYLVPAFVYLAIGFNKINQVPALLSGRGKLFAFVPLLGIARYYLGLSAFSIGDLTTTVIIGQTCVITVFVLEALFLKVYDNLARKCLSCAICSAGCILLCGF